MKKRLGREIADRGGNEVEDLYIAAAKYMGPSLRSG